MPYHFVRVHTLIEWTIPGTWFHRSLLKFWSVSFLICLQLIVTCSKCQWNDESFEKWMGKTSVLCAWQSLYDKIIYSFDPSVTCSNFYAIIFSLALLPSSFLSFVAFIRFCCTNTLLRPWFVPRKLKFKSICTRRGWPAFAMMLVLLYYYFLPFLLTFAHQPG